MRVIDQSNMAVSHAGCIYNNDCKAKTNVATNINEPRTDSNDYYNRYK